ncbi:alpha/beta fold hydrolase [Aurantiacibacter sp. D1-12]|uniref:alpha/beta fold hydrolase n=1 Tax=Aurantiacibacter sp. D1-12 TaxID=2993658 RepID=UPI00237CB59F|nr:alpha/beta hydrolase [Aurantiacibacter sp. D1-12]MDE1467270.1 alpha/beta hydrolase [Aurantiacibacter sp. D1-12]
MMMFGFRRGRARPIFALFLSILMLGIGLLWSMSAEAQSDFEPTRFSVEVQGTGPDVILIPGLSTTREVWRPHLEVLDGHRVHLLQVRGFGEDAGVNAEGPIMDGLVAELAQYIEAKGLDQPAIVGHSMGGFIAMKLGAQHPDLPGKIMIVDSLPWFAVILVPVGSEPELAQVEQQAEMARAMLLSMHGRDVPENANDGLLSSYTTNPANLQTLRDLTGDADPRVTGQLVYELMLGDMRQGIANITTPVTVIVPHRPGFMTPETIRDFYARQYAALPAAELVLIEQAAHFVMVDQPEAFDAAVRTFLAD